MDIRKSIRFRTLSLIAAIGCSAGFAAVALASGTSLTTEKAKAGKVVATTSGRAVYMFSLDTSSESKCTGRCANAWPPLTGSASVAKNSGLNASLLGSVKRSGGQTQVTYNHHPLYIDSADKAHTTKGEGQGAFGGHWNLVSPRGAAVKPKSSSYCKSVCQGY